MGNMHMVRPVRLGLGEITISAFVLPQYNRSSNPNPDPNPKPNPNPKLDSAVIGRILPTPNCDSVSLTLNVKCCKV